jgi:anthranilate synthase component 1
LLGPSFNALDWIKSDLKHIRLANPDDLPPFAGGYVGFLSYENVTLFENIKLRKKKNPYPYQALFFKTTTFLSFDHHERKIEIIALISTKHKSLKSAYDETLKRLATLERCLKAPLHLPRKTVKTPLQLKSNLTPAQFKKSVMKIKEYIRAGDIVQAVFSQRFEISPIADDLSVYRALRMINPSPYMFYIKHGTFRLVGSSPEMHVRKIGRTCEVRPIAGTRKRGKDARQDAILEKDLIASIKEQAEHLMLVDLARNDLGRVCEFKSIQVKNYAHVEKYSHVMHLVSEVTGQLKKQFDAVSLLEATFPAGTVSGAPKIRAMQIIDELEQDARGAYAGCLGYVSFLGDLDMCITIRTLVVNGKKGWVQAGAGIVFDSEPKSEYQETVNKAKAVVSAIHSAREVIA